MKSTYKSCTEEFDWRLTAVPVVSYEGGVEPKEELALVGSGNSSLQSREM